MMMNSQQPKKSKAFSTISNFSADQFASENFDEFFFIDKLSRKVVAEQSRSPKKPTSGSISTSSYQSSKSQKKAARNSFQSADQSVAFQPAQFLETFEEATMILEGLESDVLRELARVGADFTELETEHRRHVRSLEKEQRALLNRFEKLDARVANVGNRAVRIGDRLEALDRQRKQALDSQRLLQLFLELNKAYATHQQRIHQLQLQRQRELDEEIRQRDAGSTNEEGGGGGGGAPSAESHDVAAVHGDPDPDATPFCHPAFSVDDASSHAHLAELLKKLGELARDCDELPRLKPACTAVLELSETLELRLLDRFDRAADDGDHDEMRETAHILFAWNGGRSCVKRYISKLDIFFNPEHMLLLSSSSPDAVDEPPGLQSMLARGPADDASLTRFFDSVLRTCRDEHAVIHRVFPAPDAVMEELIQRTLEQRVANYLEQVLGDPSVRESDPQTYVRRLATAVRQVRALAAELDAMLIAPQQEEIDLQNQSSVVSNQRDSTISMTFDSKDVAQDLMQNASSSPSHRRRLEPLSEHHQQPHQVTQRKHHLDYDVRAHAEALFKEFIEHYPEAEKAALERQYAKELRLYQQRVAAAAGLVAANSGDSVAKDVGATNDHHYLSSASAMASSSLNAVVNAAATMKAKMAAGGGDSAGASAASAASGADFQTRNGARSGSTTGGSVSSLRPSGVAQQPKDMLSPTNTTQMATQLVRNCLELHAEAAQRVSLLETSPVAAVSAVASAVSWGVSKNSRSGGSSALDADDLSSASLTAAEVAAAASGGSTGSEFAELLCTQFIDLVGFIDSACATDGVDGALRWLQRPTETGDAVLRAQEDFFQVLQASTMLVILVRTHFETTVASRLAHLPAAINWLNKARRRLAEMSARLESRLSRGLEMCFSKILSALDGELDQHTRNEYRLRDDAPPTTRNEATKPVLAALDLLRRVRRSADNALDGTNHARYVLLLGLAVAEQIRRHIRKFTVSRGAGGLKLMRDLTEFREFFQTWGVDSVAREFALLREIANLHVVDVQQLRPVIDESVLSSLDRTELLSYLSKRADWKNSFATKFL